MKTLRDLMIERPLIRNCAPPEWTVSVVRSGQGFQVSVVDTKSGSIVSETGIPRLEGALITEALHLAAESSRTTPGRIYCGRELCFRDRDRTLMYWAAYHQVVLHFGPVMGHMKKLLLPAALREASNGRKEPNLPSDETAGQDDSQNPENQQRFSECVRGEPSRRRVRAQTALPTGVAPHTNSLELRGLRLSDETRTALLEHIDRYYIGSRVRPSVFQSWAVFHHEQTARGAKQIPSYDQFRRAVKLRIQQRETIRRLRRV
jgi:hypothetical protein